MVNFVLIPGAWLGGWVWRKITPSLEAKGHKVIPVTLTGMGDRVHLASGNPGMETAVQDVLNTIRFNDIDRMVMVGHSFAGKVAAAVADRIHDRVDSMLYLDSFRPNEVEGPQGSNDPTKEFGPLPKGELGIPLTEEIIDMIGSDVVGEDRKWMISNSTPWPVRMAADPITLSKDFWKIKSTYIFCTKTGDPVDEIIAGKWGRLIGPHRVIDSGHWPMVTRPDELISAMLELTK